VHWQLHKPLLTACASVALRPKFDGHASSPPEICHSQASKPKLMPSRTVLLALLPSACPASHVHCLGVGRASAMRTGAQDSGTAGVVESKGGLAGPGGGPQVTWLCSSSTALVAATPHDVCALL